MAHAPVVRERIIVSARLIVPTSCCGGFNEKAVRFKQSIATSTSTERLQAEIAAKSLSENFGIRVKSYVDTDNKKRVFTGETRPGVESNEFGYRWETSKAWTPGSSLVISPSFVSREQLSTEPNVGWITPKDQPKTFDEMLQRIKSRPQIRLSKYKVNPKTDDAIPGSEVIIDPFGISAGLSYEEKKKIRDSHEKRNIDTKNLPGRSLESRVPGGSLLSRSAAVFGIIRDELNKFRCPPGTPAANQFTDSMGSNCFGFSPSRFARYAARQAAKLTAEGQYGGLRQKTRAFLDFLYNDRWGVPNLGSEDPAFLGRSIMHDDYLGEGFRPPSWRDITVPENLRLFKNGAIRAQDDIARQKSEVIRLYEALGLDPQDPEAHVQAFELLRKMHQDTNGAAGWDMQVINVSGGGSQRLNDQEIKRFVEVRLQSIPGWINLSKEEQTRLIESDAKRYKETEKALFETLLDQFMKNPATARFLGRINYNFFSDDEASTSVYRDSPTIIPRLKPDGTLLLDNDGNPVMTKAPGELRAAISINMGIIMQNQESLLPDMNASERLAISAVGAVSEAQARSAVADFMVNADYTARGMAGLIDGVYSFSSHIMSHEYAHNIQAQVFIEKIEQEIREKGFFAVPIMDAKTGAVVGFKNVDSIYAMTGSDIMAVMTDVTDSINLKELDDALKRIKDIAPLAGSYPRDVYTEGTEVWALEAAAELWALRERGIIYGDDIDSALAFMDNMSLVASARERATSDDIEAMDSIDQVFGIPNDPSGTQSIPDDLVEESLSERDERITAVLRDEIKRFKTEFEGYSEDEMFSEAAIIASQRDVAQRKIEQIQGLEVDPTLPDDERNYLEMLKSEGIKDAQREFDFHSKKYDEASKIWRKKYGIGASGERKRFDDRVRAIREQEGLLDESEMEEIAKMASLDDLRETVKNMSEPKVIRRIADDQIRLSTMDQSSKEAKDLADELEVIKDQYVANLKDAGDTRTSSQIKRDMNNKVQNLISPPPRKTKKFKDAKEAADHGAKERRRIKATPEQRRAMTELGDIGQSEVGMLLDPAMQSEAGRRINRRNARLKRLGLPINPASSEEGDIVQQVETLLIPAMEAMDKTSILDPVEIETVIDFDSGVLRGKIEGKEIDVNKFVSGTVITRRTKKVDIPERGRRDRQTGKTSRRVVIQVREGDRGLFPATGGGGNEQKFVAPPGRIRIVGRDADGTIRAEISYQKDAVEVADSVANSLAENKTDVIWAQGNAKKVKASVDKYVVRRRASGYTFPGSRSDYAESVVESSQATVDEVIDSGGSFGEGFDEIPEHISNSPISLSSGAVRGRSRQDALGMPQTREQRTNSRTSSMSSNIRDIKTVLSGGNGDGSISRGDIHPEVAKLISETPEELLMARAAETAYRMHEGFDRRVRVRATESDLEKLASTGSIRSPFSAPSDELQRTSRRAERLASMPPADRSSRLSSGRIIDSPENLAERRRQEKEVATKAISIFDKIIDDRININDMSDESIAKRFGGAVRRSARKSVSEKDANLYEVDDIPTAVAMMMLGHHVEVKDQDIRLTEQAQKVFEDEVKNIAKRHIKENHYRWQSFKDKYMSDNPTLNFDDPSVIKKMEKDYIGNYQADLCALYNPTKNLMCSGHIGIDREKMPQTNGRTVGHDTKAIRALVSGHAAGKFEPKSEIQRNRDLEIEFATELDAAISKENAERSAGGKPPVSDDEIPKFLYKIIANKHSLANELGGKNQEQHKADSYDSLSDKAKEWLYENTNWNDTEVNLETPFINWLNKVISVDDPENGDAVRRRQIDPNEISNKYAPSQQQLVASKVDSMAQTMQEKAISVSEAIRKENPDISPEEFRKKYLEKMSTQWFMQPILTTKDKYILDGHHRWGGLVVANRSLPEELQLPLNANEVQTDIIEGLTLGKVFQDAWGIKEARLGAELQWVEGSNPGHKGIKPISADAINSIESDLIENGPKLVDEKYESGEFIQLGSVGLKNNANYAEAAAARQRLAQQRRPSAAAIERERQLDAAIQRADLERAGWLSSGRESVGRLAKLRAARAGKREEVAARRRAEKDEQLYRSFNGKISDITRYHNYTLSESESDLMIYEDLKEQKEPMSTVMRRYELTEDEINQAINRFEKLNDEEKQRLRDRAIERNLPRDESSMAKLSSGKTIGLSSENYAREYYSRIGIPGSVSSDTLPVSGYLVHKSHIDAKRKNVMKSGSGSLRPDAVFEINDEDVVGDGLTAFGDIEIVLRPGVSERVAYGRGNALTSAHRPVKLNSRNREDVADAILNPSGVSSEKEKQEALMHMLSSSLNNDFSNVNASRGSKGKFASSFDTKLPEGSSREPFEAQILGGFEMSDIEQVNIPFKKVQTAGEKEDISDVINTKTIAERLRASGFTPEEIQYFYSIGGGQNLDTESMTMLRNYRASQKIKNDLKGRGFTNIRFAHPSGINIEDPRSHSKTAIAGQSTEAVLVKSIGDEIVKMAKDLMKEMRSSSKPRIISSAGGML